MLQNPAALKRAPIDSRVEPTAQMEFRMLGFRLNPPGPFWFEDLVFFVIDEGRRLPRRTAVAATRIRRAVESALEKVAAFDPTLLVRRHVVRPHSAPMAAPREEIAPLDDFETWALATEPLVAVGDGMAAAVAYHRTAEEQLDSLTYVLARMRDELRPMMTYARFEDEAVPAIHATPDLETSIEALLELSRRNAATRPKDRIRVAAA